MKPTKPKKPNPIPVQLTTWQKERLESLAKETGHSRAHLIRYALEKLFQEYASY
jgi:predicted DNA-binding protein